MKDEKRQSWLSFFILHPFPCKVCLPRRYSLVERVDARRPGNHARGRPLMLTHFSDHVLPIPDLAAGLTDSALEALAEEGAAVVVNYASSKEGAERVVAEIAGKGGRAVAVQADVAKQADVRRLFAEALKAFGRLDVLVNNAGLYEFAPLEGVTAEHFH